MLTAPTPTAPATPAPSAFAAPLVVRLRDLGPALSHAARAELALLHIYRAVDAEEVTADRARAALDLSAQRLYGPPVPEFTRTVETTAADFAALMGPGFIVEPYRARPAMRSWRHFAAAVAGRTGRAR